MNNDLKWGRQMFAPLSLTLFAALALYYPFLLTLIDDWDTDSNYSHGYFIPLIFVYLVYFFKDKLKQERIVPANSGIVFIVVGLSILIVSKVGSELFLQRFSIIILLLGIVIFLFGWGYFRILSPLILYLIFMIPLPAIIWNKIAFPLQLFGSYLTEQAVRFIGIPVFREGNILHLSETTLEVVAACSGLRSLVTMFALTGLFTLLSHLSSYRKWCLFFAAAPAAIIANIIRLTLTAILASQYGEQIAQGFLHDFSGIFTFFIGLTIVLLANKLLTTKEPIL